MSLEERSVRTVWEGARPLWAEEQTSSKGAFQKVWLRSLEVRRKELEGNTRSDSTFRCRILKCD